MATLRGKVFILEAEKDGALIRLRDNGRLYHRTKGTRWSEGAYVKPGLTVRAIYESLIARAYRVTPLCAGNMESIVISERTANRRLAATQRRRAKRDAQRETQRLLESNIVSADVTLPVLWLDTETQRQAIGYFRQCVRDNISMIDERLEYIRLMVRFHSGQTGAYLGTAYQAALTLPRDYAHRNLLDTLADELTDALYGTGAHLNAARRWHRALHGE